MGQQQRGGYWRAVQGNKKEGVAVPRQDNLAAIYARVSGSEQEDNHSLDTQVQACLESAIAKGFEVPSDLVFKEVHSGAELWDRPKLTQVRELAKQRVIKALFCHSVDRLSRDPVHLLILTEEMERFGVSIEIVQEPLDNSDEGRLIQYVKGYAAKIEREKIKERTLRGKRAKLQAGKLIRAKPLYGYVTTSDGRRKINPDQAMVVRRVFQWAAEGEPIRAIARRLTEEGIPSPSGKPYWSKSTVFRMLHEEAYKGVTYAWKWKKEKTKVHRRPFEEWIKLPDGTTPPIVAPEVWEAVQARLERNKELSHRSAKRPEDYLLRGYIYCGHCRYPMWGERKRRSSGEELAYRCRGKSGHISSSCERGKGLPWINARELDAWVWQQVERLLTQPEIVAQELTRMESNDDLVDGIKRVKRLIAAKTQEEENLLRLVRFAQDDGDQTAVELCETFFQELKRVRQRRTELERELEELLDQQRRRKEAKARLKNVTDWCLHVASRLREFSFEEKRLALEALQAEVRVYRSGHEPRAELIAKIPLQGEVCVSLSSAGCVPAAAISNARRACSCPRTRRRSSQVGGGSSGISLGAGGMSASPLRNATASPKLRTGYTDRPSTRAASGAQGRETTMPESPFSRAARATASAPFTGRSSPSRESSP